jgi:hypothetical protein
LSEIPSTLGDWRQKGNAIRFDPQTETVLRTTDYTMREYLFRDGRLANVYVGYYASQRRRNVSQPAELPARCGLDDEPAAARRNSNSGRQNFSSQ